MAIKIKKPKGFVFKIFGVTTSRQFTQTLEEYFLNQLPEYLKTHWKDEKISKLINKMRNESLQENKLNETVPTIQADSPNIDQIINSVKLYVDYVSKNKIKNSSVDEIKLFIWGEGYSKGTIKVPFYADVPKNLKDWKSKDIKRYSFTSGSIEGQSAYFTNSTYGNLSDCVDGYISAKKTEMNVKEAKTYIKIAEVMKEEPINIVFLTDNINEANVCLHSGMTCILVSRDNKDFKSENTQNFQVIKSFDEIEFI